MLMEMRIRNFTVLEDLVVLLEPGLNVITGETGAGKSILVDALGVLLGGRARAASVRSGEERALVEGVLDVRGVTSVAAWLEDAGLEADDGHLLVRRELRRKGRSRAWINGSPVTAATLRGLGERLVDIHGQHEHQRLLSPSFQVGVLDAFGGSSPLASRVAGQFRRLAELQRRLTTLRERQDELERRADFLRFQLAEIRGAELRHDEEEQLRAELARLTHAGELAGDTRSLHHQLYASEDSVTDRLAGAVSRLRRLAELDPSLLRYREALEDTYHRVADAAGELGEYSNRIDQDPVLLERLRDRQTVLRALKRKYGGTVEEVIATGESLKSQLNELETAEGNADSLADELDRSRTAWNRAAEELSRRRRTAAEELGRQAVALFPGLGLRGARFRVGFEELPVPTSGGKDRVCFLASMNPGFPLAPLSEIASGGELSRVMLALKSVLAQADELPTLVFDEIDAGIGGAVAGQVGEQLYQVAQGRQVLAVTHLARIAGRAAVHLLVEKVAVSGKATTSLRRLSFEERVREIARMLSGDPDSASSLIHARELLDA